MIKLKYYSAVKFLNLRVNLRSPIASTLIQLTKVLACIAYQGPGLETYQGPGLENIQHNPFLKKINYSLPRYIQLFQGMLNKGTTKPCGRTSGVTSASSWYASTGFLQDGCPSITITCHPVVFLQNVIVQELHISECTFLTRL